MANPQRRDRPVPVLPLEHEVRRDARLTQIGIAGVGIAIAAGILAFVRLQRFATTISGGRGGGVMLTLVVLASVGVVATVLFAQSSGARTHEPGPVLSVFRSVLQVITFLISTVLLLIGVALLILLTICGAMILKH